MQVYFRRTGVIGVGLIGSGAFTGRLTVIGWLSGTVAVLLAWLGTVT